MCVGFTTCVPLSGMRQVLQQAAEPMTTCNLFLGVAETKKPPTLPCRCPCCASLEAAETAGLTGPSQYDSGVRASGEARMRGSDERSGDLFSYVDLEDGVP
jgi:hypothetical protein